MSMVRVEFNSGLFEHEGQLLAVNGEITVIDDLDWFVSHYEVDQFSSVEHYDSEEPGIRLPNDSKVYPAVIKAATIFAENKLHDILAEYEELRRHGEG